MSRVAKLSVVIPVRDGQQWIASEIVRVLEAVSELDADAVEVLAVDDGSSDATAEILDDLAVRYPQVRVARHRWPRGLEAAGQTGLDRSTGELVFIQEDGAPLSISDLVQLFRTGQDPTVVAARAQTQPGPGTAPLLRRLRAWGARRGIEGLNFQDSEIDEASDPAATLVDVAPHLPTAVAHQPTPGLQMVRRPHLQRLASRGMQGMRLTTERIRTASALETVPVEPPSESLRP